MKIFTKITRLALIGAVAAVAATGTAGCNGVDDGNSGYTFKFKVDNDTNLDTDMPKLITKVEFINGDRQNDNVLSQTLQAIAPGTRSAEYYVHGFRVEDDHDAARRKCGVRVTFEDGATLFGWDAFGHGSKVLVSVEYDYYLEYPYTISFSERESW
jgi:hypothetical protein